MSELVLATADICLHGTSSTLCEWCNYKSRIPHLESQLRDAVALLKNYLEVIKYVKKLSSSQREDEWPHILAVDIPSACDDALYSPVPESLKGLLKGSA